MNDCKLQLWTLPKLILSIYKRPTPPWMELAGFYVLISRVRTMEGAARPLPRLSMKQTYPTM